jgi:hypothetical protein
MKDLRYAVTSLPNSQAATEQPIQRMANGLDTLAGVQADHARRIERLESK